MEHRPQLRLNSQGPEMAVQATDALTQFLAIDRARLAVMHSTSAVYAASAVPVDVSSDTKLLDCLSGTADELVLRGTEMDVVVRDVIAQLAQAVGADQRLRHCATARLLSEMHRRVAEAAASLVSANALIELARQLAPHGIGFEEYASVVQETLAEAATSASKLDVFLVIDGQHAL